LYASELPIIKFLERWQKKEIFKKRWQSGWICA
jgi:hypothetical protein